MFPQSTVLYFIKLLRKSVVAKAAPDLSGRQTRQVNKAKEKFHFLRSIKIKQAISHSGPRVSPCWASVVDLVAGESLIYG